MTWVGLRRKGVEPLFPEEWNVVVGALDQLKQWVDDCMSASKQPTSLSTATKTVSTTPAPLSDTDLAVKRVHIKVPADSPYRVYVGNETAQDYVLEPGDAITLEIDNARKVYLRADGEVIVYVLYELP